MDFSTLLAPDGVLARLFAANKAPGAQPAQVTPAPTAQGQAPTTPAPQLTPSYGDFYKSYLDAAAATEKATHPGGSIWSWITGTGRDAALATAKVQAPEAYTKMLAGQTGLFGQQLDVGQTIELMNRLRGGQGFGPADASAIPGGAALSPAPQSRAVPSGRAGNPQAENSAPPAQAGLTPMSPLPALPVAPSMQPQDGVLSPPGAPTNLTALISRLTNAAAPPVPMSTIANASTVPFSPAATAPVANPLDAQRSLFGRIASAMAGLPKYSAAVPEYLKAAHAGIPEGTDVNLATGAVSDPISGRAETGDVASLLARRAGAVATAQQAPHVEAEDYLDRLNARLTRGNQVNEAGLQRGTDAARIGAENAYKSPTLMRAPDGSIVGVSPTQMAAASRTGALAGYRPLSEEDTKALGAMGEQYVKEQAALPDLRKTQNTIHTMLDQAQAFPPGTFGDVRASAGRLLAGIGADPDAVAKIVGSPAGADVVMKNTLTLAMDRLRQSFGASREAGFIVEMARKANPNIETQPEAYSFMLNTMNQEAQRQADYLTAQQAYRAQHGTIDGFAEAFDQARPIAAYANQAMVDTYGAPAGSKFLGRSKGKPVFQAPNGRKFMVQH